MSDIRFIAGLGNPGTRYEGTRHNIGFEVLDWFVRDRSFGSWRSGDGLEWVDGTVADKKILFVKPLTFMNRSGEPLQRFIGFHKGAIDELLVVHDEIDLPLGTVRLKQSGGDGGHNGLRSISQQLGSGDFARIRVGVGRPENPNYQIADWVLSRFAGDEKTVADQMVEQSARIMQSVFERGIATTQNLFN